MKHLATMFIMLFRAERRAFAQGIALSLTVLVMGVALLALSGWFITAAAAAGMIGLGILFNVFAPSAMVRFLALGRTAARYGERLTTHDATLRALSNLRVRLLSGVLRAPYRQLERLRASVFLNRVTADVDALDGLALRLVLPGAAGLAVIALTAVAVAVLVHPSIGVVIVLGYGVAPTLVFALGQRRASTPSRRAEAGMQSLRSRVIDLIAVREELVAFGQMPQATEGVRKAARYQSQGQATLDRVERQTGFWLDVIGWIVVSLAIGLGASLAQAGDISAAQAAIGIFAALALSEAVAPVRRALSEIGRMRSAAKRIAPLLQSGEPGGDVAGPDGSDTPCLAMSTGPLVATGVQMSRRADGPDMFEPVSFTVAAGETVALTGRSGCGKSTILLMVAGVLAPSGGTLEFGGTPLHRISRDTWAQQTVMVPQRHALVAGTMAENLRLAAPTAPDQALWNVLEATRLADTIRSKGGLEARLGFRGVGLSGGEARRLVLARALLCDPALLLLDEPTEGLDAPLAVSVLQGIRRILPEVAILMAAHRPEEMSFADRVVPVMAPTVGQSK
ncbi:MAG: ATP-binding cassette domain-containing protein [Roseovarius gahaiensis]